MSENKNPELLMPIAENNEMKRLLVNYVGEQLEPENDEVTMEMVIQVMSLEFPEILLAIAEENFIRGYQQAMWDVDNLQLPQGITES
tara:strand:+ start:6720 stop:6980 length:261 start_codon:yes stop_codon:yes gene_type:complete